jgi:hypothetical protein
MSPRTALSHISPPKIFSFSTKLHDGTIFRKSCFLHDAATPSSRRQHLEEGITKLQSGTDFFQNTDLHGSIPF